LLGRQLDFITELETNEISPDTLGNLFRLDHLATRMRRNAESLLVLAGVEPPRKWAAPVRLTDVIRAALGEVEDYQRVTVQGVEPATVVGAAAADLAHLLAELIENALVFSPPDQNVEVRGRFRPGVGRGRDGEPERHGVYTLAIIDSGLGMTAADIEAANRRLAGAESFTIAPSKYLGHYVAGNLASRHGIGVRLDNSPGNGITATVNIPPALLTTEAVTSAPVTPPHGMRPGGVPLPGRGPALAPPPPPPPAPTPEPAPAPPAWLAEAPPHQPARTASGLPKRAPWPGDSSGAPAAPAASHAGPSEDLLASLARLAGTSRGNTFQAREPEAMGFGSEAHDLGRGSVKPIASGSPPPASPQSAAPPGPPQSAAPPAPPPPSAPRSVPPLTRRVRGAQLPLTEPRTVRRAPVGGPSGAPPPAFAPRRAAPPAGDTRRSPDDVYSFLTSFTAGVQRGLDETNSHQRGGGSH
ncbi:MAG TPA: ATP-binding protein, partial [Acidimicrobiales bacterium]|nr:ATP-binding protein [Acidimicrobiales bacterium]